MSRYLIYCLMLLCFSCSEEAAVAQEEKHAYLRKVCDFPDELDETSGIIFYEDLVWSFNDSGNDPVLFAIDTASGEIKREVELEEAGNFDWEAIAQDDRYIYIGDIGNNGKERETFKIYKIAKSEISREPKQVISNYSVIKFTVSEGDKVKKEEYDCEAMIVHNDSIFLYTKDWDKYANTLVLTLPAKEGKYEVDKHNTYQVRGLVTASCFINQKLYLIGYYNYIPFFMELETDRWLEKVSAMRRYDFPGYLGMQTEGLTYHNGMFFISSENSYLKQGLYELILNL